MPNYCVSFCQRNGTGVRAQLSLFNSVRYKLALLACVGGLAFVVCAFGGFLLWLLHAHVFLTIASLCNMFGTNLKMLCTKAFQRDAVVGHV